MEVFLHAKYYREEYIFFHKTWTTEKINCNTLLHEDIREHCILCYIVLLAEQFYKIVGLAA